MTTTTRPAVAGALERVESHLHPTPSWDLADHPVPSGREEIWRFSPVKRMKTLLRHEEPFGGLDWQMSLPDGVTVREVTPDEVHTLSAEAPVDRVAALAAEHTTHRTLIDVAPGLELDEPITFVATGDGADAADHLVVRVGDNAQVTLVIRFEGTATYAEKTDVVIGDCARVNLVTLQDWDAGAVHGGQRSVLVGRDAHVKTVTASLGGDIVRLQENMRYAGPGGELESYGLYFVDGGQHIQHRLFVDHNEPRTTSNVDYRGALQGKGANSVWIGDVLIRKNALGIDTYESNKNLLLTEGCQADSVPNLEIETGDIQGAGHSSTTGRFDDEQLFYLMSRGVPEREARRLIVHGFFWDIIRRFGIRDIEERMLERVERELEAVEGGDL
ncbi:SufD family Fe-S cluster assembly protein [uncultured Tessaracoccus sp.]|uniref:SufB/SufD family protein n=1 Tax=uncultured Tessaracoccus sp. TaxID=905023 RepID=UPI0025F59720|nr:SufD family Fe-S cluster assembly protein [uncultured Tessaracoccus sp.]